MLKKKNGSTGPHVSFIAVIVGLNVERGLFEGIVHSSATYYPLLQPLVGSSSRHISSPASTGSIANHLLQKLKDHWDDLALGL